MVVGIRNRHQRCGEIYFSWYTKIMYGIKDPLCGMKAYRLSIYRQLGYFDSYKSVGTELMLFAIQNGFKYTQVELPVLSRIGASRFGGLIPANLKIFRALLVGLWKFTLTPNRP